MGVDYDAVLYLGREFESEDEAIDFVKENINLSTLDKEFIKTSGLTEWLFWHKVLSGTILNYYVDSNCSGFVLGIDLEEYIKDPYDFKNKYNSAISTWKEIFGEQEFNLVNTVKIW